VPRLSVLIAAGGSVYLSAMLVLAVTQAPLGSPVFFVCAAAAIAVFSVILAAIWRDPAPHKRLFRTAILLAVAFRLPLAVPPVNSDNDLIRYLWDGRIQNLGLNPYAVRPADAGLEFTHTENTRRMPSARARTPYPPAAQLFFRLVVTLRDSPRAMKFALVACDLLTILVVWRWLLVSGRNEWLTLAYAWNPLVVLEVAHSGHIDALGALWTAAAAFWLTRRRTSLGTVAFVLAVATKLLPIVLAPLLWRRITLRDAFIGAGLFVLLYLPFAQGTDVLFGVRNVVEHVRFNGPVFRSVAAATSPDVAARVAVTLGILTAAWCRWKLPLDSPVAWAWPMAVAMACAPVVYAWYLLYLTPFLLVGATFPLIVWSCSVLLTYVVWEIARTGGPWIVPGSVLVIEYGVVIAAVAGFVWWSRRSEANAAAPSESIG
jgi:alpha-1,6-mannosyltransferase